MKVFIVTAYRYGMRDAHSYCVGAYNSKESADLAARSEVDYRGGKYGCEVCWHETDDEWSEGKPPPTQVSYFESPYFKLLGSGKQPADHCSEEWKEKHKSCLTNPC
jgi:hypothetical protein